MAKQYRLSILEDDTHKSLRSFRFTNLSISLIAGSVAVIAIILIFCLIAFTPLHYAIPGYPSAHAKRVALDNAIKIDSLESSITRWEIYVDNLSRVLTGEQTIDRDSIIRGNITRYLSTLSAEELARQDSLLKIKVRKDEQFGVGNGRSAPVSIEGMHFFPPVKGVVTNGFDVKDHPAIDITAKAGGMVYAVLDGTIISTTWEESSQYTIVIQHNGDIVSSYSRCQKIIGEKGKKIKAGSPLAVLGGTTSMTKGDYLHFELWHKGEAVDPLKYISY